MTNRSDNGSQQEVQWTKRQALHLASQLPDDIVLARQTVRELTRIIEIYLDVPKESDAKPGEDPFVKIVK